MKKLDRIIIALVILAQVGCYYQNLKIKDALMELDNNTRLLAKGLLELKFRTH